MTEDYWVSDTANTGRRKLHHDQDCPLLNRSLGTREADPSQVQAYDHCRWCDPDAQIDFSNQGDGHLESLIEAAQEDLIP